MATILRLPRVIEVTGLGRSSLYALISAGRFPKPISLTGGRSVGWSSDLVDAWIAERLSQDQPTEQSRRKKAEASLPAVQGNLRTPDPLAAESGPTARFHGTGLGLRLGLKAQQPYPGRHQEV
jgi:prophage regulatory protein